MDILKYGFGIDAARSELTKIQQKKIMIKRKPPTIQRFIYVNKPASNPTQYKGPIPTIVETSA
jgi:hypothetical protein